MERSTIESAKRSKSSYSYDYGSDLCGIVDLPFESLIYIESAIESPPTTTSIESFTRDPIGFEGSEWNMYECFGSSALIAIDPDGQKVRVPCTSLLITTANTWCRDYGGIKTGPVCYRGTTPAGKTYDILMVTCNDHTCDYGDYVYLRAKIKGYCDYPHSCVDFTCPCSASEKGTICNDIWGRIRIGKNCSKYRMKLNVDCFGGAEDETHRLEREATECDCRYWTTP